MFSSRNHAEPPTEIARTTSGSSSTPSRMPISDDGAMRMSQAGIVGAHGRPLLVSLFCLCFASEAMMLRRRVRSRRR